MIEQYFKKNLGPIVHYYLQKLDEYIRYMDDDNTTFLFCTRAGYSIYALYKEFLALNDRDIQDDCKVFYVSRMLACKATFNKDIDYVKDIFINEFKYKNANRMVNSIFASEDYIPIEDKELVELKETHATVYFESLIKRDKRCQFIRDYFADQERSFASYLQALTGGSSKGKKKRVVLIDSGWQGTIHNVLQMSFPSFEFHSLLFGRITNPSSVKTYLPRMYGLIFEQSIQSGYTAYNSEKPQTCFTLHRHLIENMLEPNFSSVESVNCMDGRWCANNQVDIDNAYAFEKEEMKGVLQYLKDVAPTVRRGLLQKYYYQALMNIQNRIIHPDEVDIKCMGYFSRSVDFGKPGGVRVLRPPVDRDENDSIELRIEHSLWSMAQIAIEYDEVKAKELQLQCVKETG